MNRESFLSRFRKGCKDSREAISFGLELEHFVVRKADGRSVNYYVKPGVEEILSRLSDYYDVKEYSEGHLIALGSSDHNISIEPAAQLEISIVPCHNAEEIREIYCGFRSHIDPVLDEFGYELVTKGYQPVSKADELEIIPKQRYELMDRYFNSIGPWGKRMMRGTASTQVSVDYYSEKDFTDKYMVFYTLIPVMGLLFEDTPVFDGRPYKGHLLRQRIWNGTDPLRVDIQPYIRNGRIDFEDYLHFVMNAPIIVKKTDNEEYFSDETIGETLTEAVLDEKGVDHALSMVFPMIRLKNYIEIRTADSMDIDRACVYVDFINAIIMAMDKIKPMTDEMLQICPTFVKDAAEAIETDGIDAEIKGISIRDVTQKLLKFTEKYMKNAGEILDIINE